MGVRSQRMNSTLQGEPKSSFLSCEKDLESIIRKLFIEDKTVSSYLKRLLAVNASDCLIDKTNPAYIDKVNKLSIKKLLDDEYIRISPKIERKENEEVKSYIRINFDNFTESSNPEYRDCIVEIDVLCHTDYWELENYQLRPIKIVGYIDAILNKAKLSGIGTLNFFGCTEVTLSNDLSGYCLMYQATHGSDDSIPEEDEDND